MFTTDDIISKCVRGRAAEDIIDQLERELLDPTTVRSSLLTDLSRLGVLKENLRITASQSCVKVVVESRILEHRKASIMLVIDTYSRIYPDIDIVVSST